MSTIDYNLDWRQRADDFNPSAQRILLALSNKRWKWHTLDSLQSATRLEEDELYSELKELLDAGLVRGSFVRETRQPTFALVERVNRKSVLSRIAARYSSPK